MSQGLPRDSGLSLQQEFCGEFRGYGIRARGYGVRVRFYDRNYGGGSQRIYRSYGVEPEYTVSEPEDMTTGVMGWSQRSRGYGVRVRVRGYGRSYGVEPEVMV